MKPNKMATVLCALWESVAPPLAPNERMHLMHDDPRIATSFDGWEFRLRHYRVRSDGSTIEPIRYSLSRITGAEVDMMRGFRGALVDMLRHKMREAVDALLYEVRRALAMKPPAGWRLFGRRKR